ncbi:ATP synthase subunit B [Cocleimonas flava]|uniref:ATP synthase subunit b n=1 Tax=Cocleimonas flava TaxID=634765 RepID=A0A4R1F4Y3_9GAMM|nr:F0F1 ATP synthase subunit delta [Cocleimonas flava]TCJ87599.1 ATP synthase F0 subcomplex B subunit [Cocleimonas flava]
MEIDWLTVSAQIVNFLVLVWLLKRFLYKPIIDAMDRRQKGIADNINEAKDRDHKAQLTMQDYENKIAALEQDKTKLMQEAEAAAQEKRLALEEAARKDVQQQKELWQKHLHQEQKNYLDDLSKTTVKAIQDTGRRVFSDLSDSSLETQIITVFLKRLHDLDDDLLKHLKASTSDFHIVSAFELEAPMKQKITQAIHKNINDSANVNYIVSSDLLCGISLDTGGYQVGWNIDEYLKEFDQRLLKSLNYNSDYESKTND